MRISVVIPAYRQAQYLPDAIESCISQTRLPNEIIVVDDGSPDNTHEIAKKYQVKVIRQVNKGLASARNTGIMNAIGDYILFLDSDDILLDNAISAIIKCIEETGADIVSGSFKEFGIRQTNVVLMENPKLEDFKTGNRIGYCSAVKREALLEVGGYSPRMTLGYEDLHLWVNLLSRGKVIKTIQEIIWLYRTKEYSMINDSIKHHEELMGQIFKDFPDFGGQILPTPLPQ